MVIDQLKKYMISGGLDKSLTTLYGGDNITAARERYVKAITAFGELYGIERDVHLFSVPGRSELSGNHTDHNNGKVIAASVDTDIIAVASVCEGSIVRIKSEGYGEDCVDPDAYVFPKYELFGSSASIIAGMISGFKMNGYAVGGFDAYITSNVLKGSGLSSSAAYEVMVGTILSDLYNDGKADPITVAKLSKYAENEFFGKPCGLMDQVACANGGAVYIDFENPKEPVIKPIDFDFDGNGYRLCIVNAGADHADLTADYAAIPGEMKAVAKHFGKTTLREVDENDVLSSVKALRAEAGDRAVLRALHYFAENRRVDEQIKALKEKDLEKFLTLSRESGRSSFCYLQNVYNPKSPENQGLSLALCLADGYLCDKKASFRVHGGGFGGTIQAILPKAEVEEFKRIMDAAFGEGACAVLRVRNKGAVKII